MKFQNFKTIKVLRLLSALLISALLWIESPQVKAELIEEVEDFKEPPIELKPPGKPPQIEPARQSSEEQKSKETVTPSSGRPSTNELKPPPKVKGKNAKVGVVKFWSKSLSGLRNPGALMLEEDVVVTQDDIRLEADKATIFFEPKSREVREVHAVGAVRFSRTDPDTGQPIRAEGREAVFDNAKRLVTMKGEPILHRGDDVVRGKVIYYDLKNGWVKADRVEGVVQPASKKAGPTK